MVTGKNKVQFEKWYKEFIKSKDHRAVRTDDTYICLFNEFPLEFQIGVYLAYYESLGKKYISDFDVKKKKWFIWMLDGKRVRTKKRDGKFETEYFDSRPEADKSLLVEADIKINEKL